MTNRKKLVLASVVFVVAALWALPAAALPPMARDMLAANVTIQLELDGVGTFTFSELVNLATIAEVVEYQDGEDRTLRKRPGRNKVSNLILRGSGVKALKPLWDNYKTTLDGHVQRHDGRIRIRDSQGQEIVTFEFKGGWVSSWKATVAAGSGSPQLVEEIELAIESLTRTTPT